MQKDIFCGVASRSDTGKRFVIDGHDLPYANSVIARAPLCGARKLHSAPCPRKLQRDRLIISNAWLINNERDVDSFSLENVFPSATRARIICRDPRARCFSNDFDRRARVSRLRTRAVFRHVNEKLNLEWSSAAASLRKPRNYAARETVVVSIWHSQKIYITRSIFDISSRSSLPHTPRSKIFKGV